VEEHSDRLCIGDLYGGLTSIIQICGLIANKDFKHFIRNKHFLWRTKFVFEQKQKIQARGGNANNERITIKGPLEAMINIVEDTVNFFNEKQRQTESIRDTFRKVN